MCGNVDIPVDTYPEIGAATISITGISPFDINPISYIWAATYGINPGTLGYVFQLDPWLTPTEILVDGTFYDPDTNSSNAWHPLAAVTSGYGGVYYFTPFSFSDPFSGTTLQGEPFTARRATGPIYSAQSNPYYVVDLTTHKRTTGDTLNLGHAVWVDDTETVYPFGQVIFYFDEAYVGYTFTLHYYTVGGALMTKLLTPTTILSSGTTYLSDGTTISNVGKTRVVGDIPIGSYYYLTRNSDGLDIWDPSWSPPGFGNDTYRSWAPVMTNPSTHFETRSFQVPSGMTGYVKQDGTYFPLSPIISSNFIEDYDSNANPHFFYYNVRTALVDPQKPFWLKINGTELSQGATWFYNGWSALNGPSTPPPPDNQVTYTIGGYLLNHSYKLVTHDTQNHRAGPFSFGGEEQLQLYYYYNPWGNETIEITVPLRSLTFGVPPNESWDLIDLTTNQVVTNTVEPLAPVESIPLQISQSRWGHDLRLRLRIGEEYSITPGSTQGYISSHAPSYQSYYYFDANSSFRSGIDYWIYDATTDEDSPWNQTDLIEWIYTPPPYELDAYFFTDGSVGMFWPPGSSDPDGGFVVERRLGTTGSWTQIGNVSANVGGGEYSEPGTYLSFDDRQLVLGQVHYYRIRYYYGSDVSAPSNVVRIDDLLDSDNDGLPDGLENRLFGNLTSKSGTDNEDGDAMDNATEWLTNPDYLTDYYNGVSPLLYAPQGDGQIGFPGTVLPDPIVIQVKDTGGSPMVNAPVFFDIYGGTLLRSSTDTEPFYGTLRTDAQGIAKIWIGLPRSVNTPIEILVRAGDFNGAPTLSLHAQTQDLSPPVAPMDLKRTRNSLGQDVLTWTDSSDEEEEIYIERQMPDGTWVRVNEVPLPANTTTFTVPAQ